MVRNQVDQTLCQWPWWNHKGSFSCVSLSKNRLDKTHSGPRSSASKQLRFWFLGFQCSLLKGCGYQFLYRYDWGIQLSGLVLCWHWPFVHMILYFIITFYISHQLIEDLLCFIYLSSMFFLLDTFPVCKLVPMSSGQHMTPIFICLTKKLIIFMISNGKLTERMRLKTFC